MKTHSDAQSIDDARPLLRAAASIHSGVPARPDQRPFLLRPRVRATVVVVLLGTPLLLAYVAARIFADALWFDELNQADVYERLAAAKVELFALAGGAAALFLVANLGVALSRASLGRSRKAALAVVAVALVTGGFFASSAAGHWQTFLLWRHRQSFGVMDPIHGKDVGYFVFSYPFELMVSGLLLWLVAVAAVYVSLVYLAGGALGVRPLRATYAAQVHLGALAATFLLVVAWRLRLAQYGLELSQPSPRNDRTFAGAGFIDVYVRSPVLVGGATLALVLALVCVVAPRVARNRIRRRVKLLFAVPGVLAVGLLFISLVGPALAERFVVDPSPLAREGPFLKRSIVATRGALGLDKVDVQAYEPAGGFTAAEISRSRERFANVLVWEKWALEARMRELVTETPYYSPQEPTFDIAQVDGRRRLTVASARELDLQQVREGAETWSNDRLAYTHGLGVIRFSGTDVGRDRQPRLLDGGLGIREPRIYFGNLPHVRAEAESEGDADEDEDEDEDEPTFSTQTAGTRTAESPWVLAATRRPEVDLPASEGAPGVPYHYDGTGGIVLSSWIRRGAFALELGSKELLLSNDITSRSRILLHRDVLDRLRTVAPFIQWDAQPATLTANGGIVYLVDGYTTSANYPYAERVNLGGAQVNYARASVRATINAFSGRVDLFLTDASEPIARAWAEAYPTLFRPGEAMPAELRSRVRYPPDLFAAQATSYERFHTTRPNRFASKADAWSRPIALSGPIEVAADVTFEESDEDELRLTMEPGYKFSPPPGGKSPLLLLETVYSPSRGQNLVASLSGWVDGEGRTRLAARILPRDRVVLGPAQVSRLVFGTPRVRNLLGLRNLEVRDLGKSSLQSVLLGEPHLSFLPGGVVQIQPLYEGSRGPGAARLLGVTAFLNGRAGLGPNTHAAVRQALNKPPRITFVRPPLRSFVGKPVELTFRAANAQRAVARITSPAGKSSVRATLGAGRGTATWVPSVAGLTRVRVEVVGLDGTVVAGSTRFRVLSEPPTVRLTSASAKAVVGRPMRIEFEVKGSLGESAEVSTRSGIEFTRRYLIGNGTGYVEWTPGTAGTAVLRIRARGRQGQSASVSAQVVVAPAARVPAAPTLTLVRVPDAMEVGRASRFTFRASGCNLAVARIEGVGGERSVWQFRCAARPLTFAWTPSRPGSYRLTLSARGSGGTRETATQLTAGRSR